MNPKHALSRRRITWAAGALAALGLGGLAYALLALDQQPVVSPGPVEFSNFDLTRGGATAYRGDYVIPGWAGDLVAYNISSGGIVSLLWRARDLVEKQNWDTDRKIFTSSSSGSGVPFRWSATGLTTAQKTHLGDDTNGPKVLNYLRGDTSNERTDTDTTKLFRDRLSPIGAIIRSRPFYWSYGQDSDGDAIARVYVGANDGMLHAFDAGSGKEIFAYVPSMLIPKIKELSEPSRTSFKYYVDGTPGIAKVPTTSAGTSKKTMLISGLGSGAAGVFGLDITSPSPASEGDSAAMAKFEITPATTDYTNIGYIHGTPNIVQLESGTWAALVPNGVNSSSGVASLFVINPLTGEKLGEVSAGEGPNNGLGSIAAVDTNGNGKIDRVYAGDLKGTLWKFSLAGSTLPSAATALFTPDTGTARPITASPSVIAHPRGGFMVNFGTGQVFEAADLTSTASEYIYGIWDSALATGDNGTLAIPTLTEKTREDTSSGFTIKYRVGSSSGVNYGLGHKGWRIALSGGERLAAAETFTSGGRYVVTTTIPNTGATQGSWMMQIDALTGGAPARPFFDLNGDGTVNTNDDSDRIVSTSATATTTTSTVPIGKFLGSGVWSQPVLAKVSSTLDMPFLNFNSNATFAQVTTDTVTTPPSSGDRGVYGGHFDFDIYYNACNTKTGSYSCPSGKHQHEYDDKYDVVGVNMLNASLSDVNLSKAISAATTPFKILVANTQWSPAARLLVEYNDNSGTAQTPINDFVWKLPLSPEGFLSATPNGSALTLTRAQLTKFIFYLPRDAFQNKEWRANSGDIRAGLFPSVTGCVRSNKGAQGNGTGPWMNGALTFQIVKASTTASDVQATTPADAGGYRLKKDLPDSSTTHQSNQLAQYTAFWHHDHCYNEGDWTKTPALDTATSNSKTPSRAAGSADPTGAFLVGTYETGSSISGGSTTRQIYQGKEVIVTYTYNPLTNSYMQTITLVNASDTFNDGTKTPITRAIALDRFQGDSSFTSGAVQLTNSMRFGRLSWREVIR